MAAVCFQKPEVVISLVEIWYADSLGPSDMWKVAKPETGSRLLWRYGRHLVKLIWRHNSAADNPRSQIYTRGRCAAHMTPTGKIFILKRVLGHIEMRVEFQLSSSSSFRDMRGSQIYTRGCCAPRTLPSGKIFIPAKSTWSYLNVRKISTFYVS